MVEATGSTAGTDPKAGPGGLDEPPKSGFETKQKRTAYNWKKLEEDRRGIEQKIMQRRVAGDEPAEEEASILGTGTKTGAPGSKSLRLTCLTASLEDLIHFRRETRPRQAF